MYGDVVRWLPHHLGEGKQLARREAPGVAGARVSGCLERIAAICLGQEMLVKRGKHDQVRESYMGDRISAHSTLYHHPRWYCALPWCRTGPFHGQM